MQTGARIQINLRMKKLELTTCDELCRINDELSTLTYITAALQK